MPLDETRIKPVQERVEQGGFGDVAGAVRDLIGLTKRSSNVAQHSSASTRACSVDCLDLFAFWNGSMSGGRRTDRARRAGIRHKGDGETDWKWSSKRDPPEGKMVV